MQNNKWVLRAPGVAPHVTCDLRLICLPPAGIGAFWVHGWEKILPSNIEVCSYYLFWQRSKHAKTSIHPTDASKALFSFFSSSDSLSLSQKKIPFPFPYLPTSINPQLCPVELPGRNSRIREKPFSNMSDLVNAIIEGLTPLLQDDNNTPYAFFGHSMGAWLAYAITKELERRQNKDSSIAREGGGEEREEDDSKEHTTTTTTTTTTSTTITGVPLPVAIYASANRSPTLCGVHHDVDPTALHQLPPNEFWPAFERRYGINPDLKDAAVRKFVLPMLKADFSVIETYQPLREGEEGVEVGEDGDANKEKAMMLMKLPASIRLVIFGGEDDTRYTGDQLQAWKEVCSSNGDDDDALQHEWGGVHWFSGSHHFYNQSREMLVQFIIDDLNHNCIDNNNNNRKEKGDLEDSVDFGGFGSPISSSTVVVENRTVEIESVMKGMATPSPFEMNRDDSKEREREEEEEEDRSRGRVKASDTVPRPKPGCVYLRRRWCF
jgi:medium-chain acyl-[acyl-carrier-protein] hydrolase